MSRILTILFIALTFESIGVVLLGKGLRSLQSPEAYTFAAVAAMISQVVTNPHIVAGVACEAVFFAGLLYMMARADVSFIWPLTALTFVFSTLLARFYLGEEISQLRWGGVALIVVGAGLITYSEKRIHPPSDRSEPSTSSAEPRI